MDYIFGIQDLWKMQLDCLPTTRVNIDRRATNENWPFREVKGKGGKGGLKRVFKLPDYVIEEMERKGLAFGGAEKPKPLPPINALQPSIRKPSPQSTDVLIDDDYEKILKEENRKAYEEWVEKQDTSKVIPIRYYREIYASAGFGSFNDDEISIDVMWFRENFIKKQLRIPAEELVCIRVKGDSMQPTIMSGCAAMVHFNRRYNGEGIYLIRQGDELKLKRLQMVTSNIMHVISDNKELYPLMELDLSNLIEGDFAILGECLWYSMTIIQI